jgi:8-oxo-dGTP pyrophosphatase MutT (NUDIX family)
VFPPVQKRETAEVFLMRKDIQLSEQLQKRQSWKDALVDAVVATVLFRQRTRAESGKLLDRIELLVTQRKKGAEKEQFQAHHGGFLKVTDRDIYAGAAREVLEETGFELNPDTELRYIMSIGPEMYRSELLCSERSWSFRITKDDLLLRISNTEAEPNVAFCLPIFVANVGGTRRRFETDGEVANATWMTVREIISQFGNRGNKEHSQFNYFQILVPVLLYIGGRWKPDQRPDSLPGEYHFCF